MNSPSSLSAAALSMEELSISSASASTFRSSPRFPSMKLLLPLPRAYAYATRPTSMSVTHVLTTLQPRRTRTAPPRSSRSGTRSVPCGIAVDSEPKVSVYNAPQSRPEEGQGLEDAAILGARVRVKAPVKVYHVPRVPEVDLTGMEGTVKQFVGVFRGTKLSASLPFKVEFVNKKIEGGSHPGHVKFSVHLKEDEFDYV